LHFIFFVWYDRKQQICLLQILSEQEPKHLDDGGRGLGSMAIEQEQQQEQLAIPTTAAGWVVNNQVAQTTISPLPSTTATAAEGGQTGVDAWNLLLQKFTSLEADFLKADSDRKQQHPQQRHPKLNVPSAKQQPPSAPPGMGAFAPDFSGAEEDDMDENPLATTTPHFPPPPPPTTTAKSSTPSTSNDESGK
jgi:hypothetical protein